ncbi:MAG: response regulator [Candidatus Omnitrophica bacterium]|nr:response regulator [Candidatus Omnitrophota bacterium]MBU4478609.1 response regulator [Candidatus Omnitrophota bacterium]
MSKQNKPKILVVDDEPINVKLLEANLLPAGYEVITASNGEEALCKVAENEIDLVVLDVMMPGVDGFEVTRRLRADETTQFIPIVLVTALKETAERIQGIDAGCDDFISKPFDRGELLSRVKSLLRIKYLRDELDRNYRKLKELEDLKDNLLHMVVHDMNNLANIICLGLEFLRKNNKGSLTQQQLTVLEKMTISADALNMMIGNLLDINKMEEGKLKLSYESFSLYELAKDVISQMQMIAVEPGTELLLEAEENMPEINADKELIRRVIANLIGNAVKFTPDRENIRVGIFLKEENGGFFYVQVKDKGKGIPAEYAEKIFEKFAQVGDKANRRGRGLGLAFCKMAVEAHGGRIWVESGPGMGSLFTFSLPRNPKN